MRRVAYGLLALMVCFGTLYPKIYTNKTFLMPRSHNDNMAMEYSTWHKQVRTIDEDKFGGTVQLTGFYQESTNERHLGEYFGKKNSATGPNITNPYAGKIQDFIWVKDRNAGVVDATNNEYALLLDPDFIFHDWAGVSAAEMDKFDVKGVFRPRATSYGVRLDYHR